MGETVERQGPKDATLADVYDIDMGRRIEDLGLWGQQTAGQSVIEVGCGNGRVPRLLDNAASWESRCTPPSAWVGIDVDERMVASANQLDIRWFGALVGDARSEETWAMARTALARMVPCFQGVGAAADRIVVPYSTLFLVPHDDQATVLHHAMASLMPGGLLLAECFVPELTRDHVSEVSCRAPESMALRLMGATVQQWYRRSAYRVDAASRTTVVDRVYGPTLDPQFKVSETIYWRRPAELLELAEEAGLVGAEIVTGAPVPKGHVLLVARG